MRASIVAIVVPLLLLCGAQAAADTRKFAVVFGNNRGHDPEEALRYAHRDAAKFHQVLTELGGFSPDDTTLLLGADAPEVTAALDAVGKRIVGPGDKTGDRSMLLIYFSGHAEGDVLELGNTSLSFAWLRRYLAESPADVRLAFLDSCLSGKLISGKGGRRGRSFDMQVTDEITSTGYAIVTSSAHNELSQESAELRGAFFTHYLVSALRGDGDESGDGKVTLQEAYQYAYSRTLARTSATIGGGQHPMYQFNLEGRGELVLTTTGRGGSHISIDLPEDGRLVLLDAGGEAMVAEALITAGETSHLAVQPGEFVLYLITPEGSVRTARADVRPGEETHLGADDFESTTLEVGIPKGGLFSTPNEPWTHRLGGSAMWRLWPLDGATASYGAQVFYRMGTPRLWQPTARLTWSTRDDVGLSTGYNDVGISAGMGRIKPFRWILLRVEILAGYEHIFQSDREGSARHTSGFDYLGLMGLEIPLESAFFSLDAGAGGRVFQVIGEGWVHRLDFQASIGFGFRWEVWP